MMTPIAKLASANGFASVATTVVAVEAGAVATPQLTNGLIAVAGMFGVSSMVLFALILLGKALVNHFIRSMENSFKKLDELPDKASIDKSFSNLEEQVSGVMQEVKAVDARYAAREAAIAKLQGQVWAIEHQLGKSPS